MNARQSIRRHLLLTAALVLVLVVGIGGWAYTSEFAGAVIAQGSLVVDTSVKKVQHPTGGVVAELKVRDGNQVKAGDIVIRLDDTQTRANLQIVAKGLDELSARRAREESELEGEEKVTFPAELLARKDDDPFGRALVVGPRLDQPVLVLRQVRVTGVQVEALLPFLQELQYAVVGGRHGQST